MESIEVAIAEERYAEAWVEFQSASEAENRLLKGEPALQSGQPLPQASRLTIRDLAPIYEAHKRTCERQDSFNRAAAIYRESITLIDREHLPGR